MAANDHSILIRNQLYIQAVEQHDQLLNGLETASNLIPRLHAMEALYLHSNAVLDEDFMNKFRERMIVLYSKVLEHQARALSYLRKRSVSRIPRDILKQDPWEALLQDMNNLEREAQSFTALIDKAELNEAYEKVHRKLQTAVDSFQTWQTKSSRDEKVKRLFNMLYTSPYRDRKDRNAKNVPRTCGWFTRHPRFRAWIEGDQQSLLWVSADPGCGKSVLTRHLVDEALVTAAGERTICYFFFKDDFEDQKSSTSAIASILRQLLLAKPHFLPDSVLDRIDTDGERLTQSFDQLWSIFVSAAANPSAGEVICIFDALDECQDDDQHPDRRRFIEAVTNLYGGGRERYKLKFLITSRPYGDIRSAFRELTDQMPTIHLSGEGEPEMEKISREIDLVINSRVHDISKKKSLDPDERQFLQEQLTARPNRTYLWVSLTLNYIEGIPGFTKGNVRRAVHDEIPDTVEGAYNKILNRSPDQAKARRLLHIITAAKRPLTLQELSLCMALRGENQSKQGIMDETEPVHRFKHTVRDLCGLLLAIVDDKIYLLHQTVKEFLVQPQPPLSPQTLSQNSWKHTLVPTESNKVLAEICVWYLLAHVDGPEMYTLDEYSARYWPAHFREASFGSQERMAVLGGRLCTTGTNVFDFWSGIYSIYTEIGGDIPFDATPLIVSVALGLEAVAPLLLETEPADAGSTDEDGRTPLSWAALHGLESTVKLLIQTGKAEVDSKDSHGQTPLHFASEYGYESVAKLLIETANAHVDSKNSRGDTPLLYASSYGQVSVAKLLIETGKADVNVKNLHGQTPLHFASAYGHESMAKLLIEIGKADVDPKNSTGDIPLHSASLNGHVSVAKLLIETGKADVNVKNLRGETPLHFASKKGHVSVANILIGTGKVDVNSKNRRGETALFYASTYGDESLVKLLIESGKADVNSKNRYGQTPLFYASGDGNESVVKLLLRTAGVEIDSQDSEGQTPLSWASENGHHRVITLLLETGAVQMDAEDELGQRLLSWAVEEGHEAVAQMLRKARKTQIH
jgi:ankyrin repeat protein